MHHKTTLDALKAELAKTSNVAEAFPGSNRDLKIDRSAWHTSFQLSHVQFLSPKDV